jgi:hypothetical protein
VVPPDSGGIPRVPPYSGSAPGRTPSVSRTGLSPASAGLPRTVPLPMALIRRPGCYPRRAPTTPRPRRDAVWAPPRSLAATGGISFDFSSCRYLDGSLPCVSLPRTYVFGLGARGSRHADYSIRTPADRGILAPPRGFSQLIASFLTWWLPGILRRPMYRLSTSSFPSSRYAFKNQLNHGTDKT